MQNTYPQLYQIALDPSTNGAIGRFNEDLKYILGDARRELLEISGTGTCNERPFTYNTDGVTGNPRAIFLLGMMWNGSDDDSQEHGRVRDTWRNNIDLENGGAGDDTVYADVILDIASFSIDIKNMLNNENDALSTDNIQTKAGQLLELEWPAAILDLLAEIGEERGGRGSDSEGGGIVSFLNSLIPHRAPQQTWQEKARVSSVRTAAFWEEVKTRVDKKLKGAEGERGVRIEQGGEVDILPTTLISERLDAVFAITLERIKKTGIRFSDDVDENDVKNNFRDLAIKEITGKLYNNEAGHSVGYIEAAFKANAISTKLQQIGSKGLLNMNNAIDAKLALDKGYNDLQRDYKRPDTMQQMIGARKIYIAQLKAFAEYIKGQAIETQMLSHGTEVNKAELNTHIAECELRLAALEAISAHDNFRAQRAAGAGIGVLPGLFVAGGGGVAAYIQSEAGEKVAAVALDALKDVLKGSFDKLGQGLAAGNPILWAVVGGACLGLIGMVLGIVSAAEAASHINDRDKALRYFESKVEEKIKSVVSEREAMV